MSKSLQPLKLSKGTGNEYFNLKNIVSGNDDIENENDDEYVTEKKT